MGQRISDTFAKEVDLVHDEQKERFDAMRELVDEASRAVESMRSIVQSELMNVRNDSSRQAEQLQRIQQDAGRAVYALSQTVDLARHARSYQAQTHSSHEGNKPQ
jgi:hypothetical protein